MNNNKNISFKIYANNKYQYAELNEIINWNEKIENMNNDFDQKVKAREKELDGIKFTKSYLSKNDLTDEYKTYHIHDNCGRPFQVKINNFKIQIQVVDCRPFNDYFANYKSNKKSKIVCPKVQYISEPIYEITDFEGYWYGYDPSAYKEHGNTLLVKIQKLKYLYIGPEIFIFESKGPIIDFISTMRGSDMPCPLAYDDNDIYFLPERKSLPRKVQINLNNADSIYWDNFNYMNKKIGKIDNTTKIDCKIIAERVSDC